MFPEQGDRAPIYDPPIVPLDEADELLSWMQSLDSSAKDGRSPFRAAVLNSIQEAVIQTLERFPERIRPRWIAVRRQLWLGRRLIKQFHKLAPQQTAILEAFEKCGWAEQIVDPLRSPQSGRPEMAKKRLRQTIENLNRSLPPGTVRFRGDGTGFGIRWELCVQSSPTKSGG